MRPENEITSSLVKRQPENEDKPELESTPGKDAFVKGRSKLTRENRSYFDITGRGCPCACL